VCRVGPPKLIDINKKTTHKQPVEDRYTLNFDQLLEFNPISPFAWFFQFR